MGIMASAGNKGKDVRSDCFVAIELTENGGIALSIQSKVEVMYGEAIKKLILDMLQFYEIINAKVSIEDVGALDFIICARMEAAIKKLLHTNKDYLPEMLPQNKYETKKDKTRFSRLYLPGNTPRFIINAGIHKPDGIILDLEDSVAFEKKDEARFLVRNALRQVDFYGAERMVRINQFPRGLDDLDYIIPHHVNLVLLPKCETPGQIQEVEERILKIKKENNLSYPVWIMPILESASGIIQAYQIACSSENIVALAIGLEDYTADLGVQRTQEGTESFFARFQLVNAAKAAGIQAIDSVYSDIDDMAGLKNTIQISRTIGFEGMGCIHPRQIPVIHEYYAPEEKEIERAKKIVEAFKIAESKGLGVVSLGSKMIDPPVVKRALKTIELAISLGKLNSDWHVKPS